MSIKETGKKIKEAAAEAVSRRSEKDGTAEASGFSAKQLLNSFTAEIRKRFTRIRESGSRLPYPLILGVLIVFAALELVLIGFTISLQLLPALYLILFLVILLAIDVGLFVLLTNEKKNSKRFYTGMILTVVLMILMLPATYYLQSTGEALKRIVGQRDQWEEYDVVALKEGSYESIDDIKGKQVYALKNESKMNEEAREKLITAANVDFKTRKDIMTLGSELVDSNGGLHDNLIFISKSYYKMQCEEIDDFKKNTKVIHTMDVMKRVNENSRRIDVTKDPFNIYITGIDTWGNIEQVSRSDVNMIVTVNPQTRQILLTSIPRDAYVELHSFGQMDKLTHTGIYGVDETLDTVSDWLDVDLDHYVKMNFSMVVRLVGAVDGIDVYSDEEFDSSVSKYHYKKGWNHMHGKQALFFARERKSFEMGDQERIKNQQKVLKALIKKVTSSRVILTHYPEILDAVSENMVTDISNRELRALARMQLRDMDTKWSVETVRVACTEAYRGTWSMGPARELFVNIPQDQSVEAVKKKIHDVMYPAETEKEEWWQ